MIGRIRGRVWERAAGKVILDVQGVGYELTVTAQTAVPPGEEADLYVYTHVREDTLQLFGFGTAVERQLFDLLLAVPNVGPVKAMQILQSPVELFVSAVSSRDAAKLAKLPGVGKKTAERILVDLVDKVTALAPASVEPAPSGVGGPDNPREDLISALQNLGFRDAAAEEAAGAALAQGDAPLQELVRRALALLSDRRAKDRP